MFIEIHKRERRGRGKKRFIVKPQEAENSKEREKLFFDASDDDVRGRIARGAMLERE